MKPQAKRRPMLNESAPADPRNPENWGGPDPLPAGRFRGNRTLMDAWRDSGNLHPAVEAAAYEIENVHTAVVAGLWTKTASYGERTGVSSTNDWPARIAIAYRDRYGPWKDEMAVIWKKTQMPIHATIVDAIIDGHSLRQIDRARQWKNGTASGYVKWGLWRYCVMAGWVKEKLPTAS